MNNHRDSSAAAERTAKRTASSLCVCLCMYDWTRVRATGKCVCLVLCVSVRLDVPTRRHPHPTIPRRIWSRSRARTSHERRSVARSVVVADIHQFSHNARDQNRTRRDRRVHVRVVVACTSEMSNCWALSKSKNSSSLRCVMLRAVCALTDTLGFVARGEGGDFMLRWRMLVKFA